MSRTFQANDLVTLPKLSSVDAIALATAMVARARKAGPLPALIDKSLVRVEGALQGTHATVSAHVEDMGVEGTVTSVAYRVLAGSWGACRAWCSGWSRLPNQPDINAKAERMDNVLFADGLRFTQRKYNVRWVESQARLDLIDEQGLEPIFVELGGQRILDTIRDAHAGYGQALGLTVPADETQTLSQAVRALLEEMRRYVVRVSGHAEPDEPATQALVENLLWPLANWRPTASSTSESTEDDVDQAEPSKPDVEPAPSEPADPTQLVTDLPRRAASGEIKLP
jgi:hypothetical protein